MAKLPTDRLPGRPPLRVAVLGADSPGLRIRPEVAECDRVASGQVLFRDAKYPEVAYVSSIHGRVAAIETGARRMLSTFVIDPVEGEAEPPDVPTVSGQEPRAMLLERGLWPAFTARPFGGPPAPDATPGAILVCAVPAGPSSPDPGMVLQDREAEFAAGLEVLTTLTEGPVHLCLSRGIELAASHSRIRLHRLRFGRRWRSRSALVAQVVGSAVPRGIWTIGYQDVAAIGHLVGTGRYDPIRSVAVHRPGTEAPQILRVPMGSDLRQLIGDGDPGMQTVSGPLDQRRAARFLGRHDDEAGLVPALRPVARGRSLPVIAFNALDRALPFRVPAVPLMRALCIGDAEACARLGCLDLLEEDVAHLSAICASGTDYARRMREVLDHLRKVAA